jgi:sialic acid synthase SpsE
LNPDEFASFVLNMRLAWDAACLPIDGSEDVIGAERAYRSMMRKHVVAARDLEAGDRLSLADLALKRTSAEGAVLTDLSTVLGHEVLETVKRNSPLRPEQIR